MALPARLDGLGIIDPTRMISFHHNTSLKVSGPLVALILQQATTYPPNINDTQRSEKLEARRTCRQHEANSATELMDRLPDNLQRAMTMSIGRRVHRHGCPLFPLQSVVLPFTKGPFVFVMPSAFAMDGTHLFALKK